MGGVTTLGPFGATAARLLLSVLTLGAATFLMGGTMPAAAKAVERDDDRGRSRLAFIYGVNTLGAVTGVVLSTFLLIEVLGNRTTLFLAVAVNLGVGLVARFVGSRPQSIGQQKDGEEHQAEAEQGTLGSEEERGDSAQRIRHLVLPAAALVGFLFMLMELVWYRMLSPLLGGSTYTFGLILAMALLGIGLGGVLYSVFGARREATVSLFAWTCGLEALFFALPLAFGDRLAVIAQQTRPLGNLGFSWFLLIWCVVAALVVLPAAVVSGFQFPVLVALMGKGKRDVAKQVGSVYAWNTLGAIAGSLAGGFFALTFFGAVRRLAASGWPGRCARSFGCCLGMDSHAARTGLRVSGNSVSALSSGSRSERLLAP